MNEKNRLLKNIDLLSLITQAPISLISQDGETIYCPTVEDHHYLSTDVARYVLRLFLEKHANEQVPFIHLYSLSILQGVIRLSETEYLFIGPVCITQPSLENSLDAFLPITTNEEAFRLHSVLEKFVPLDFFRFAGILAAICNSHAQTEYTPSEIINLNFIQNIKVKPFEQNRYANTNQIPISSINFFQQSLYSIISTGNMDALIKHWQNHIVNTLINLNLHIEDVNFLCIPFYSYMFQGAIKGGADIHVCLETYIGQVERFKQTKNMIECITELKRSSYEYCNLVKDSSNMEFMPNVCNLCVSYINDHIHEKITVENLTHITGIHRNKLYRIFRANFDMTISDYIEKERLRRAVIYLESSNYSTSEIASTMGYSSQSHFITIFKKHYGCTPTQHLKNIKRNNFLSF